MLIRQRAVVILSLFALCSFVGCAEQVEPVVPVQPGPEGARRVATQSDVKPRSGTLVPELVPANPKSTVSPGIVPAFSEVASESGIDFTYYNDAVTNRFFLPEVMGGGAAWFDYDMDRRLDLYLTNGCRLKDPDPNQREHLNRLFRNTKPNVFADVTIAADAHDPGFGQGCAVGDFDVDGFPDLYLTNYGRNSLFRNNGDGTFADVTDKSGMGDPLWGSSAVWFDADSDGNLDLYVVNYLDVTWENAQVCKYHGKWGYCGPGTYEALPDRLYLSRGDGTFSESADQLGFRAENGKGLAVVAADFDGDLRVELYVANDMAANFLFTRTSVAEPPDGNLYHEVAVEHGCAMSGNGENEASMGIACADFDGDGLLDIFLTHFYGAKNTLYRNLGGLMFDDDSYRTRAAATAFNTLGFGIVGLDFDRNGSTDLFITNGHVLGRNYEINELRPQLLRNDRGVFWEVSESAGPYFHGTYLGRGAAGADYDNDGDIDLAVTHLERPMALLRNDTQTGRHFLGLSLHCPSRIPPIGGRIVVATNGHRKIVPIVAGGSYLCSSDQRIIVGLDADPGPVDVEVIWPSGCVEQYKGLSVDRYWRLLERGGPESVRQL